ncbi:proline--tRNA ligase [Candidatus Dependentiae bacterium]|nr:proline--tRNA ligase [Candidatus Dependentiae bacterium]
MSNTKLADFHQEFSQWYNDVVYQAELADLAPVRGCMVIRPYGMAIWEQIKDRLDARIKATGHHNAAFPLFIPQSFLTKEAEHVEGFAPEVAVVTHAGGEELAEPLIVRPTSETIIHYMFAQWIRSWRDLPLKINQWCNVVRWEMRPRPFLRTTEFYWQEGHTAHETEQEALDETLLMLREYRQLYEGALAIPVIEGRKSDAERFAGADRTYTLEGIMADGKALQLCTSHMISQSFAQAFGMKFQDRQGAMAYPYLTSWGFTTRSIGALIMTHGDQKGLIIPPVIAPIQVVIIPIIKTDTAAIVRTTVQELVGRLQAVCRVHVDANDQVTPGAKFFHWELKGVPYRIEIGAKDIAAGVATVVDRLTATKRQIPLAQLHTEMPPLLAQLQQQLYDRAKERMDRLVQHGDKLAVFGPLMEERNGAFITGWCQSAACEQQLKNFKATTRCLPGSKEHAICFACDKASIADVLVAKAY